MAKLGKNFSGTVTRKISRDEIYHRLEWLFDPTHNPAGPHSIAPSAPISSVWRNFTLENLWVAVNNNTVIPAWNSSIFHNVPIPWVGTAAPPAKGVRDVKNFGDLVNCVVAAYQAAGWVVT